MTGIPVGCESIVHSVSSLHPLIEQIQSNVPNLCLNVWYLDDGSLCGPPNALSSALEIIDTVGP